MTDDEKSALDPALAQADGGAGQAGDSAASPAGQPGEGGPGAAAAPDGQPAPQGADQPGGKKKPKRRGSFLRELPILIVIALGLALLIKTYAFQAYFIPSGSMENTLDIGDKVLVNKIVYHLRPIHRGDIIVFNGANSWGPTPPPQPNVFDRFYHAVIGLFGAPPGTTDYIKRVIGLPGDDVRCCNARGQVTVNGVALSEKSYLYPGNVPSTQTFNVVVPKGRLWVMGDHRAVSYDSREHNIPEFPDHGTIPENEVVGRAFAIVWPPSRWRILPIPATFEQPALNGHHPAASAAGGSPAAGSLPGAPVKPEGSSLPLAAGVIAALPLTWGQRRLRHRIARWLSRRR